MKIYLDEKEIEEIMKFLPATSKILKTIKIKMQKNKTKRKRVGKYRKALDIHAERLKLLEELVRANFNTTNDELMKKMGVSKTNFYIKYNKKAKELREMYKSQSLF